MTPPLGTPWVGNLGEERWQGTHMLGTQHHLRGSMAVTVQTPS
jgi:hypothetical protein